MLAVPPEQVFELVADSARLAEWAPGLARVELDGSDAEELGGAGTVRTLVPRIGRPGREIITSLDRVAHRLAYSATDDSLAGLCVDHRARIECDAVVGGTRLTFVVAARPAASAWRWWIARAMFALAVAASLRGLRRRFHAA